MQLLTDVVLDLVSLTLLDPVVEQGMKEELVSNVERVRGFYAGDDIDEEAAFSWWGQFK